MGMMSRTSGGGVPQTAQAIPVKPLPKKPNSLEETLRRQAGGSNGTILTGSQGLGESTYGSTTLLGA